MASVQLAKAFDDDGFYVEVLPADETPQTYSGTTEPSTDLGKIGDIYIKIEE